MNSYIGKEVFLNLDVLNLCGVQVYDYWRTIEENGKQSGSGTITLSCRDYVDEEGRIDAV